MSITAEDLQRHVEAAWAAGEHATWPDPHPNLEPPDEAEYSRVTDPGRYRIAGERVRLWADTLVELLGACIEEVDASHPTDAVTHMTIRRAFRVVPPAGGPDLVVWEHALEDEDDPADGAANTDAEVNPSTPGHALTVSVTVAGSHVVTMVPFCGGDACDDGSEALLDTIDEAVLAVVSDPSVWWRRGEDSGYAHSAGSGFSGTDRSLAARAERHLRDTTLTFPADVTVLRAPGWLA